MKIGGYGGAVTARLCVGLVMLWMGACASSPEVGERPREHVVARGESLQVIAWRYGVDLEDLVRWNRIGNPNLIRPGQRLVLVDPATAAASTSSETARRAPSPRVVQDTAPVRAPARDPERRTASAADVAAVERSGSWRWPVRGQVIKRFEPDTPGRKGIQIGGELGQPVVAAKSGEVVYGGSGLPGYGRLIIVKHSEALLSAYGYLGKILVNEGDKVGQGQTIGELGSSAENRPALHFEIRQNGRPVDPLRFLSG